MRLHILNLLLFFSVTVFSQNTAPTIKSLFLKPTMQGEQGVIQNILKCIAYDKEDKANDLSYVFRIVSGKAKLTAIKRNAILEDIATSKLVVECKVIDSQGDFAVKTFTYTQNNIDQKELYTDRESWYSSLQKAHKKHRAMQFQERNPKLPNILLIGNSISIGYTPFVQKILKGKANVCRIPENGGDTQKAVKRLDFWLGDKQWDVIHFNFGLHDIKRLVNNKLDVKGDKVISPEVYASNLEKIVAKLKAETKAKLIWATTSVVPEGADGRIKGEEVSYNKIALAVMKKNNIQIDDQYSLTLAQPEDQQEANVHFHEQGCKRQAEQVVQAILQSLKM